MLFELIELEIGNRDDALVVGQLLEEGAQRSEGAGHADFNFLSAVVVLLDVILRKEFPQHQTICASAILNALQNHRQFTLFGQQSFELFIFFLPRLVDGAKLIQTLRRNLRLRVLRQELSNLALNCLRFRARLAA